MTSASLTVYFEGPFWVGLWERTEAGRRTVCRIVFGPEPRDETVYQLILGSWGDLRFSPPVDAGPPPAEHENPKRLLRQARRQMASQPTIGTKSQQALALQRESGKQARQDAARERRQAEEDRRFALRQAKRRAKHRGH